MMLPMAPEVLCWSEFWCVGGRYLSAKRHRWRAANPATGPAIPLPVPDGFLVALKRAPGRAAGSSTPAGAGCTRIRVRCDL